MRIASAGMLRVAWLSASTPTSAAWRNSSRDRPANSMWRIMARSGQSIWSRKPALWIASYSAGQRLAERQHIGVAGLVVCVGHEMGDDAGRGGVQEGAGRRSGIDSSPEVRQVGLQRPGIARLDGRAAGRRIEVRQLGVGAHAGGVVRMGLQVRRHPAQRLRIAEAPEPVLDIVGVGDFRHLAVADDVDAAFDLLPHDLRDRFGDTPVQQGRIVRPVTVLRDEQVDQVVGPRQAADMGGKDAVGGEVVRNGCQGSISPSRRRGALHNAEAVQRFKPVRGRSAFAGRPTE